MSAGRSLPINQYQVGVICALPYEMTAAMAILDERHQQMAEQDKLDENNYVLGRVHDHNVVIACLPAGMYGTNPAARVARDMIRTFTGLRIGLMLGIGGGIPNLHEDRDIRLGDVVISQPDRTYGGVVQYDLRKNLGDGQFARKGTLNSPPSMLLAALARLQAEHDLNDSRVPDIVNAMHMQHSNLEKRGYRFPGQEKDNLYCSECSGSGIGSCDLCTDGKVKRPTREDQNPVFWYGVIASGNELIKNTAARDALGRKLGALCVETEAAGLMNDFPCMVIRGICDYTDSHKNDIWQKYAALTAAAYTKELLMYITPEQTSREKPIQEVVVLIDSLNKQSRLMEEHFHETKRESEKQDQRYQSDQARRCHQAFKTSTYEQFKDVNPNRVEGTCQWVLSHSQYLQWARKDHDDLLWISADPGCGKSVLAKSLIDNELRAANEHTVCYFFFKDNEEQDRLATALCALLHQLFSHQPQLIQHAISAWDKIGDKLVKEVPELWRILLAAARSDITHDVTCVLDALDECRLPDRQLLIDMLADFYTQISHSPSETRRGRLRFLVTSRPYDEIRAEFQKTLDNLPTIRLQGEEENDRIHKEINLVIQKRVEKLAKDFKLDHQTKSQLEAKLLEMKHRTYLWLYLAIGGIYETFRDSMRLEKAAIESLPSNVEDAYEKLLNRGSKKQRDNVKKILQIVIGARRPLIIQEMAIALGIATAAHPKSIHTAKLDPGHLEKNIRHWCGLFIFINHAQIYLIHQTAKEFLICNNGSTTSLSSWKYCLNPRGIENEMTQICVKFLCLKDSWPIAETLVQEIERRFQRIDEILDKGNDVECLFVYTAEYWPSHFRDADIPMNESVMAQISQLYDTESTLYRLWFTVFWKSTYPYENQPQMNSIRLAAFLGHEKVLKLMLQSSQHYDVNEPDMFGRTALMWTSQFGYEKVVQILLEWGANVNAQGGNYDNALQTASYRGHEKVVQILLEWGANVNAQGGRYDNALQAASYYGYEKVVQILLKWGANVNAQGGNYGNALQAASYYGYKKVVQVLLKWGANVNAQGGPYGNALRAASIEGHKEIVEILLAHGADIDAQGEEYINALQAASLKGHKKIVEILLANGADVNAQGRDHSNALQRASACGHEKVVEVLLAKGADINAQGRYNRSALQAASSSGYEKVVQILLTHGANVNAQGGRFHSNALQAASSRGHKKVVEILLEKGADVNAQGERLYNNALQAASEQGHEKIVEILLANGANPDSMDSHYRRKMMLLLGHGERLHSSSRTAGSARQH